MIDDNIQQNDLIKWVEQHQKYSLKATSKIKKITPHSYTISIFLHTLNTEAFIIITPLFLN